MNSSLRTLVIDDSGEARLILLRQLKRLGFDQLESAQDGVEGMEKVRSWHPQLVFLDGVMPRKDGLETLLDLKAAFPSIVVVMCTSLADRVTVLEFRKAGADLYILKPYDREMLEEIVTTATDLVAAIEGATA